MMDEEHEDFKKNQNVVEDGNIVGGLMEEWMHQMNKSVLSKVTQLKQEQMQFCNQIISQNNESHQRELTRLEGEVIRMEELTFSLQTSLHLKQSLIHQLTSNSHHLASSLASFEKCAMKLASEHHRRVVLRKVLRAWMALRGGWREMVETACKARARHLCVQLADKYEEEINKLKGDLEEARRDASEERRVAREVQTNLKAAFSRGVSALTQETSSILQQPSRSTHSLDSSTACVDSPENQFQHPSPRWVHFQPPNQHSTSDLSLADEGYSSNATTAPKMIACQVSQRQQHKHRDNYEQQQHHYQQQQNYDQQRHQQEQNFGKEFFHQSFQLQPELPLETSKLKRSIIASSKFLSVSQPNAHNHKYTNNCNNNSHNNTHNRTHSNTQKDKHDNTYNKNNNTYNNKHNNTYNNKHNNTYNTHTNIKTKATNKQQSMHPSMQHLPTSATSRHNIESKLVASRGSTDRYIGLSTRPPSSSHVAVFVQKHSVPMKRWMDG